MRLYTLQSTQQIEYLTKNGILNGNWEYVDTSRGWQKTYRWMVCQMEKRSIACHGHPPIWAWHSCGGWEKPPTLLTVRMLLSDVQIQDGMHVIEFTAPSKLVLLSIYRVYGRLLDANYNHKSLPKGYGLKIFALRKAKIHLLEDIQATLPYLKMEWVVNIRPLHLKVDDWNFDVNELI